MGQNPFAPQGMPPAGGGAPMPPMPPGPEEMAPAGGGELSPQDIATLAAAFTPQVVAILARLSQGSATLDDPTDPAEQNDPGAAPSALPRPQTKLGGM